MEKRIREMVDRLLLEQGEYAPLELLLAEGRLFYEDYEQWRQSGVEYLEESLFGDPEQILGLLRQAADYAVDLGLDAERTDCKPWGVKQDPLRFSLDPAADRLFFTRYRKPTDEPQLDLFMDTSGSSLANGVVAALVGRDGTEARRLLDQLFDKDPGNNRLGGLERLVEAAEGGGVPAKDIATELELLEKEIEPLARELLAAGSRDFLAPLWQRLGLALANLPFDPASPKLHASYMALRGEAWGQLRLLVEAEPDWQRQPPLLLRHAQACGALHQEIEEIGDWFRLCWDHPDQASHIKDDASPAWRARWRDFLELEPELSVADFPAWSLLHDPGLAKRLDADDRFLAGDLPEAYKLTAKLVVAAVEKDPVKEQIETRKQLQGLNPTLLLHYLQRFGTG